MSAYHKFMEFVAQSRSLEEMLAFKATLEAQRRAEELTERNKAGTLSDTEKFELEEMLRINRLVAKLRQKPLVL